MGVDSIKKNKIWEKISSGLHFSPWGIHVLAIRALVEKAELLILINIKA